MAWRYRWNEKQGSSRPRGSRSSLRHEAAKPALALLVFTDREFESGTVEIRPIGRHENKFAVRCLPEKKIRQTLLTACANDEVGIGNVRRVQKFGERIHVDVGQVKVTTLHGVCHAARRAHDFLARAIIKRNDESETVIVFRNLFRLDQQSADVGFKIRPFAYHANADIAFVKFGQIVSYEPSKQPLQFADFAGGSGPAFCPTRNNLPDIYAELARAANGPAQGLDPPTLSFPPAGSAA